MPGILATLHFEQEMGLYFEITSGWHGSPGSLVEPPGFQSMELHCLWYEFVCLWWNSSISSPETEHFKKTFEYISSIEDADL